MRRRRGFSGVLVGWLWADLLLALFAIFAVANTFGAPRPASKADPTPSPTAQSTQTVAPPSPTATRAPGIDPTPIELSVQSDAAALLSADPAIVAAEQARVVARILEQLGPRARQRAAVVLAFGHHRQDTLGERLAEIGTARLNGTSAFRDAAIRTYHYIDGANQGAIDLLIYFHQ